MHRRYNDQPILDLFTHNPTGSLAVAHFPSRQCRPTSTPQTSREGATSAGIGIGKTEDALAEKRGWNGSTSSAGSTGDGLKGSNGSIGDSVGSTVGHMMGAEVGIGVDIEGVQASERQSNKSPINGVAFPIPTATPISAWMQS
eukprot:CAMPEP_0115523204 /NCGR_PEP_ID=MMETSP0271-20121206/80503_1 /TAXON_ID=71861 /ORGANISM="Scrippsiella trochoidea, Strain CCMP3099" /LENGTH=142 /DNA_ID=CAMNT_0002954583 /DNA_START=23 /DNA_END=451 /DNA_ORIENTATION=+